MGDSGGDLVDFLHIENDIRAAIDEFCHECPNIETVILWGLCDAATAAAFYAPTDLRVSGLVLLNPWVRSVTSEARAYLKHYYLGRFFSMAFWKKIFRGEYMLGKSLGIFIAKIRSVVLHSGETGNDSEFKGVDLAVRVYQDLAKFGGKVLLICSGSDLTAAEFMDNVKARPKFTSLLESDRFTRRELPEADHTFSRSAWRDQVSSWVKEWGDTW
jgi:exosortase A-associated hydrolase 1